MTDVPKYHNMVNDINNIHAADTEYSYTLSTRKLNWTDAQKDCESKGGSLAAHTSANHHILMKIGGFAWIGGTDATKEGVVFN